MTGEPIEVAEHRPRDGEQPHTDDRGGKVEDGWLLTRSHDEPGAHGKEGHGRGLGREARREGRPESAERRNRAAENLRRRPAHTATSVGTSRITSSAIR